MAAFGFLKKNWRRWKKRRIEIGDILTGVAVALISYFEVVSFRLKNLTMAMKGESP